MMAIAVRTQARNVRSFAACSLYRSIIGHRAPQIVVGATTFRIMTEDGPQSYALKAGMVVIVPQWAWNRFEAPDGVSLMTTTPQPTQHLTFAIDDPRTLE